MELAAAATVINRMDIYLAISPSTIFFYCYKPENLTRIYDYSSSSSKK